jgi:hypothetical protein
MLRRYNGRGTTNDDKDEMAGYSLKLGAEKPQVLRGGPELQVVSVGYQRVGKRSDPAGRIEILLR